MKLQYLKNFPKVLQGKLFISLLVILGCQSGLYGQTMNNPMDPESLFKYETVNTPTTAALIQNIVYPVNYSTGLPEIKIPLYEVKSGSVTLPIYLTYHASGIKLNDVDGWTGAGWNLVAEPMVSRIVQGRADASDMTCKFDKNAYLNRDYVRSLAINNNWEQPDEFYYRLLNKQGMFMYSMEPKDSTKKFLPLPYEDIRIDWITPFFKIIDDDGTIYKFNGGAEYSDGYKVGWKASSITSANRKDSISFSYDTRQIEHVMKVHNDYMVVRDNFSWKGYLASERGDAPDASSYLPDEWMQDPIIYSTVNDETKGYQRDENGEIVADWDMSFASPSNSNLFTRSQYLQEIRFNQGKIVFTLKQNSTKLGKITVYNLFGEVVKEIQFNYIVSGYLLKRYFLESIVVTSKDGNVSEKYRFGYYEYDRLPHAESRAVDYWGYFNGKYRPDDETLIPWQTITATKGEMSLEGVYSKKDISLSFGSKYSRESDEECMMYGVLNEITYPTGSTDEFIYEANRYLTTTEEENVRIVGGLRVKQIKTKVKDKEIKVRTFKYGEDEDGNGYSLTYDDFNYFMLEQNMYLGDPLTTWYIPTGWYYAPNYDHYITARQRTFFCNPIWPITHSRGSSVMYSSVTEYNGTPEKNSGKTVYRYHIKYWTTPPNGYNTIQSNPHNDWKFGHLVSKVIYKNDNGIYKPLESIENDYSSSMKSFGKILIGEAATNAVIREAISGIIPNEARYDVEYARTTIDVGAKLLMKSRHVIYADSGTVSIVTNYEYADPSSIYPTRITETGSDSVNGVTILTYPKDYKNVYPYTEMARYNILNSVVKKEYVRDSSYIAIETPFIKSSENIYVPSKMVVSRDSLSSGDVRAVYSYDGYGKVRQEVRNDKETIVYLYGYKNQHVIARVENATYAQVVKALGGESMVDKLALASKPSLYDMQEVNNLRYSLLGASVITYTYEPLVGVASITDPLGVTTGYEYDGLGRLSKTYIMNNSKKEFIESYEYNYTNE